ncbi:type 1 glutamine amidotransferase [Spiribacter vilamensis]|uniref:GMP synthase-like glutamine amidotransferase n=1 Tax=Spiribacter vilamensis TaxID=531306 RepID=A0A4Q8D040_9GAMM|nr:type 1 glutamine amidotransferase [Spiribacter vilamensis]RZU98658.1 GMP synthase-like glutamine amidotransferase [Spiribacter vilamensis]TVO60085.1 type 1 glutamine amidotransferase [Spiribacter vilamensis]
MSSAAGTIRVGVLLCDDLHEELATDWASYFSLFENLLTDDRQDIEAVGFRVHAGEWPETPASADAWVVTGSRASVHEAPEWVAPLKAFVRSIDEREQPLIGVCFGHQLIQAALGGETRRSSMGWHLGTYAVECEVAFAGREAGDPLALLAVHQDQVVAPAPGFERLATSAQCPWYAMRRGRTLTIQGHPEFDQAFFAAIMERVRPRAGDAEVDAALETLPAQDDTPAVRAYMREWVR